MERVKMLYLTTSLKDFPTVPIPGVNMPWCSIAERRAFEQAEECRRSSIPDVTLEGGTSVPSPDVTRKNPVTLLNSDIMLPYYTSVPIPEVPLKERTSIPIPEVPLIQLLQKFTESYSALIRWIGILRELSAQLRAFAEDHPELGISPDEVPHQQWLSRNLRKRLEKGRIPGMILEKKKRKNHTKSWHLYSTRPISSEEGGMLFEE
jgi:hypothetical protein